MVNINPNNIPSYFQSITADLQFLHDSIPELTELEQRRDEAMDEAQ